MDVEYVCVHTPVKTILARNIKVLQVFFLQELVDFSLNFAHILQSCTKMKLFLQDTKILHCKKIYKILFLLNFDQILHEKYLTSFLARLLQDFYITIYCIKSFILVQDLQDMCKI